MYLIVGAHVLNYIINTSYTLGMFKVMWYVETLGLKLDIESESH